MGTKRQWWNNLTPKQQDNYIKKIVKEKAKKRKAKEEKESKKLTKMRKYKNKFCSNCFHFKMKCCDGLNEPEKSVCKSWFKPK